MSFRRFMVPIVLAAFIPMATVGCFGKFQLTKKVYKYNQDMSPDKWIQWFGFLVMSIIPIYGLAVAVDAVFANSIEFWTGENPIMADTGVRRVAQGANGELAIATFRAHGIVDLQLVEADGTEHALTLVREDEAIAAYDADGKLLGRVGDVNGVTGLLASR